MKKNNLWKKKLALIGLATTLTATSLSACQKDKTSGMKEADGESVYYVQDANKEWHVGLGIKVFNYENGYDQIKHSFLAILCDSKEGQAYFKSLENPESKVIVTFDENGKIADMQMQSEELSEVEIISMENHKLTSSLTYEDVEKLTNELNDELKRK